MTLKDLFKKRNQLYYKKLLKHSRYIFNDHFSIVLFFLIGAGGYSYSNYLENLSTGNYQSRLLLLGLFFFLVIQTRIKLIVEPADQIFLLVKEEEFYPILKKEIFTSYLQSLLITFLFTWMASPIILITRNASKIDLFLIFLAIASIKWLNMLVKIYPYFYQDELKAKNYLYAVRVFSFFALILILFLNIKIISILVTTFALFTGVLFINEKIYFEHSLRWPEMISEEEARLNRLYRLIAIFVDIPQRDSGIKALSFMNPFIEKMTKKYPKAPYYYSLRTIIRNTEYRSLIIRINILAVFLLFLNNSYLLALVFTLLFLYILGFQLISLIQMNMNLIQFKITPVEEKDKVYSTLDLMNQILQLSTIVMTLAASFQLAWYGLFIFPIGLLFSYLFSFYYVPYRLKSSQIFR